MARPGDVIDNPMTGERIVFRRTGRETGGEVLEMDVHLTPSAAVAASHLHARQEETVEILEGSLRVRIGDDERVLGPGEQVVVPPGAGHEWWAAGTSPVVARVRHRPALDSDAFFEDFFTLARTGKTDAHGKPGLLRTLVLARRHEVWLATIPVPLQRALAALTAPLAHLLGLDARPVERSARAATPADPHARA